MSASPEKLAELRKLDQDFKLEMKKLDIDAFKFEVEDGAGARKLFKINIWPQIGFSGLFVFGYFLVLFYLFTGEGVTRISENGWAQCVVTTVFGVLTAAIPQILNFWFGSSLGSKEKTRGMQVEASQKR